MDPVTASYYRSILYHDGQDQRPVPPTLAKLHAWTFKRFQAMGAGGIISKQAALSVALMWMSMTSEGRAFARENTTIGELFCPYDETTDELTSNENLIDWDAVPLESKVLVVVDQKPTVGEYIGRQSSWIKVLVNGERKSFRSHQVQLAGA